MDGTAKMAEEIAQLAVDAIVRAGFVTVPFWNPVALGLIATPALVFSRGYLEPTPRGRAVGAPPTRRREGLDPHRERRETRPAVV